MYYVRLCVSRNRVSQEMEMFKLHKLLLLRCGARNVTVGWNDGKLGNYIKCEHRIL